MIDETRFDQGYLSPYFINNDSELNVVFENAYVLLVDGELNEIEPFLPILTEVINSKRPLIIIAEDIIGKALSTLVVNKIRGYIRVVACKAPGFGELRKGALQNIATITSATIVSESTVSTIKLSHLGTANRVIVDRDTTFISVGIIDEEHTPKITESESFNGHPIVVPFEPEENPIKRSQLDNRDAKDNRILKLALALASYEIDEPHEDGDNIGSVSVPNFMVWMEAEHDGDCTRSAHTCMRCLADHWLRKAKFIVSYQDVHNES